MTIPRLTTLTLGVDDLSRSTHFYRNVFGLLPRDDYEGIVFFELPGTWLILYPKDKLAEDIGPGVVPAASGDKGFNGLTLAYNARSQEEVRSIFALAKTVGATIAKAPQETFWGGYSGYFQDPDGYYWEVVWGPMFDHAPDGSLLFRDNKPVAPPPDYDL
jgi:catechol 2,3-dioxygenase-like lactoylglutathione lyase family enzyme